MKMFIISDNKDFLTGMRFAGVDGKLVSSQESIENVINNIDLSNVAILLITRQLALKNQNIVSKMKKKDQPLVIEVPDKSNLHENNDSITRYVQDAMGIKM